MVINMNTKYFRNLEIVGVFLVFGLATLLHFIYDLTDGSVFSILFGAINESVWENTKIFLIAYAIWALIELLVSNVYFKPFVVGKVLSLYFLGAFIIVFHYLFALIFGKSIVWIDVTIGFLGVLLSQIMSYKLVVGDKDLKPYFVPSLFLLGLFLVGYFSFSVFPPHIELFRDETTGFYGILPDYADQSETVMNNL